MKDKDKRLFIYEQSFRGAEAIALIEAAKRQAASAYETRLRRIKAFMESLRVKHADVNQLELWEPSEAIDKEVEALLVDPLGGL